MDGDYGNALDQARDLVALARAGELPPVAFRDDQVAQALGLLGRGRSVLLTGPAGAGKTAVVRALAAAVAERGEGHIYELSTTALMAGTRFLGEWQTKLSAVAELAEDRGAYLYLSDVWNLATVGRTSNDPSSLLDALGPLCAAGRVRLIGEASPEVLREMERVPGFTALFSQVVVPPLGEAEVDAVLDEAAGRASLLLDAAARRTLLALTKRFLPSRPQPGPALELCAQVADYRAQKAAIGEIEPISAAFIERVFSIYSGLPMLVVSDHTTMPARDVRAWFAERIVGQSEAIEAVVETIALYKAGLADPARPIGSFLFVGPTGVGKTEVARALAEFLFGSAHRLLRFDLSEFKDYLSFEMLVGSPGRPEQPARLVDPVRAQPFQVVLLDELEKAHANVWDLLLQLLDDGRLTPPGGQPVSFRNTIVIATSNAGAQGSDRALGFGARDDLSARAAAVRQALEREFRPELLNRFGHLVVFHPLSREQVRRVARQELTRILRREGITGRNLVVDVDDEVLDTVIDRGFDPRWGARGLKREIQRRMVLPLAMTIMERQVEPGTLLKLSVRDGEVRVRAVDTAESRAARREREPVRVGEGRKLTRPEIGAGVAATRPRIEALAAAVDEPWLRAERGRLLELRAERDFWNYPEDAALALRDLDRYTDWIERLERLRGRADDIERNLAGADLRRELHDLGNRLVQLEESLEVAHREMVVLGREGLWDALVEIRPLGEPGRVARDLLVEIYRRWADGRRMAVEWLREPLADDEPAMLAIKGRYAAGLLAHEAGMHKVRGEDASGVAVVTVAAWTEARERTEFLTHRALKLRGQAGGAIRSRLECEGDLVLQNARTLAENRELAAELAPSWRRAPAPPDEIVRRYDLSPLLVRDVATGISSGRPDALSARPLHDLLCARVDTLAAR